MGFVKKKGKGAADYDKVSHKVNGMQAEGRRRQAEGKAQGQAEAQGDLLRLHQAIHGLEYCGELLFAVLRDNGVESDQGVAGQEAGQADGIGGEEADCFAGRQTDGPHARSTCTASCPTSAK